MRNVKARAQDDASSSRGLKDGLQDGLNRGSRFERRHFSILD